MAYIQPPVTDVIGNSPDQPHLSTGGTVNGGNQVSGGGLSICAGHTNHPDLPAGVSVEFSRYLGKAGPCIVGKHQGHSRRNFYLLLNQYRGGAGFNRLFDIKMPVCFIALYGHKQKTLLHKPRIIGYTSYIYLRVTFNFNKHGTF